MLDNHRVLWSSSYSLSSQSCFSSNVCFHADKVFDLEKISWVNFNRFFVLLA